MANVFGMKSELETKHKCNESKEIRKNNKCKCMIEERQQSKKKNFKENCIVNEYFN
jgi:hypothetical protein